LKQLTALVTASDQEFLEFLRTTRLLPKRNKEAFELYSIAWVDL
jgi:hypothetical protein